MAGTGSTLFFVRLFWIPLRLGGNWLHIIFRQIFFEAAQIWRELAPHFFLADCFGGRSDLAGTGYTFFFWRIVLEAVQIWRELAPHYFLADCFGGSSDLAGTGSTIFSGGLFWGPLRFGGNWLHIIFRRISLEVAQI